MLLHYTRWLVGSNSSGQDERWAWSRHFHKVESHVEWAGLDDVSSVLDAQILVGLIFSFVGPLSCSISMALEYWKEAKINFDKGIQIMYQNFWLTCGSNRNSWSQYFWTFLNSRLRPSSPWFRCIHIDTEKQNITSNFTRFCFFRNCSITWRWSSFIKSHHSNWIWGFLWIFWLATLTKWGSTSIPRILLSLSNWKWSKRASVSSWKIK